MLAISLFLQLARANAGTVAALPWKFNFAIINFMHIYKGYSFTGVRRSQYFESFHTFNIKERDSKWNLVKMEKHKRW